MTRLLATLTVLLLILGLLLAFTLEREETSADFTYVNRGSIGTLDPARMSWMQDIRAALTLWEGLATYHPKTSVPIAGVAYLPPKISEDGRVYTFQLRPEARWSNGDPVTAHDFVYAWRRAMEPGTAADYVELLFLINGARDYFQWRNQAIEQSVTDLEAHWQQANAYFDEHVGIKAIDKHTLEVELVRPTHYFVDLCAFSTFLPLHRNSVEQFREEAPDGHLFYGTQWVKPQHLVANGPFMMADWQFKRRLRMVKNPYYWDAQNVSLNVIDMLDIESIESAFLMYEAGEIDWLSDLSLSFQHALVEQAQHGQRDDIHSIHTFGTYFYNLNCLETLPDGTPNPLSEPKLRLALNLAVDKEAIVNEVTRLGQRVATTFIPPQGIPNYLSPSGLAYDPKRARALFSEAGFPDGKNFPPLDLLYNTGFRHEDTAQAIARMWQRELGIEVRLRGQESKTFREEKQKHRFMVCRASWVGDYTDPTTFLDMFVADNGNNDSAYRNPQYDTLIQQAAETADSTARMRLYRQAETILVEQDMPLLPIYHHVNQFAFRSDQVEGLHLNPRLMTMLKYVKKVEPQKGTQNSY